MLIKAQMQLPAHDFTQLLQLIPERLQVSPIHAWCFQHGLGSSTSITRVYSQLSLGMSPRACLGKDMSQLAQLILRSSHISVKFGNFQYSHKAAAAGTKAVYCLQDEQPLSALIALTQHLEGARFTEYWQTADSCKSILGSVPGYYDAIRKYILYVISDTCQKATKTLMADSLRLDEAKVDALVRHLSGNLCRAHLLCLGLQKASCRSSM